MVIVVGCLLTPSRPRPVAPHARTLAALHHVTKMLVLTWQRAATNACYFTRDFFGGGHGQRAFVRGLRGTVRRGCMQAPY